MHHRGVDLGYIFDAGGIRRKIDFFLPASTPNSLRLAAHRAASSRTRTSARPRQQYLRLGHGVSSGQWLPVWHWQASVSGMDGGYGAANDGGGGRIRHQLGPLAPWLGAASRKSTARRSA